MTMKITPRASFTILIKQMIQINTVEREPFLTSFARSVRESIALISP